MEAASDGEKNKKRKNADDAPMVPMIPLTKSQRKSQAKQRQKAEQRQMEKDNPAMAATYLECQRQREYERKQLNRQREQQRKEQLQREKDKQLRLQLQKEDEKRRKELQELDEQCSALRNNMLTKLKRTFTDNQAKAIGAALVGNTLLEALTVRFEPSTKPGLTLSGIQALCDGIPQSQLNKLKTRGNIADAKIHQCLYQAVEALSSITILSISLFEDKSIDEDHIISLGQALMNNSSLCELSFGVCSDLTEAGAEALLLGLQHSQIQKLQVSCGDVDRFINHRPSSIAFYKLFEGIQHKMQSLEVLTISNFGSPIPFRCIADGLQSTTTLKELVLEEGDVYGDAMRALSQGLSQNNSVTILRLMYDVIYDDDLIELASSLRPDSCLQELQLNIETEEKVKKFGPCGVQSLIRAVTNMPAMQKLNLSCTAHLAYLGWKTIGDELPNLTLRELDLRFDHKMCEAWLRIPEDTDQEVEWYELSEQALLQGMRQNEHIWKLSLFDDAYDYDIFDEMHFYSGRNQWGRRLLTVDHGLPSTIWCYILEQAQKGNSEEEYSASLVYYILRKQPHLVQVSR